MLPELSTIKGALQTSKFCLMHKTVPFCDMLECLIDLREDL